MQSALSKPVVRFAIAAAVGIATGYAAIPALIKAELVKAAVLKAAVLKGIEAASQAYSITSKIGNSGSSGIRTDGGTLISASSPVSGFNGLGGSQRNKSSSNAPNRGLGYYGLEAGKPDKEENYNPEDAVWKLMNAVNAAGGFNKNKKVKNNKVNPTLIGAGDTLIGTALYISLASKNPFVKIGGLIFFGVPGAYLALTGAGVFDLDALADEIIDETIYAYPPGYNSGNYYTQTPDGI